MKYKLGDIATFSQGKQVDINDQFASNKEGSKRFVRIIDYTNPNEPPRYVSNYGDQYYVSDKEVAMIRYGSQTAGKVVMGKNGIIANNLFKITIDNQKASNKYIYYYLSQKTIFDYLRNTQSSSTMPAISFNTMNNLEIELPPIAIQDRIVRILSSLDKKIELNNSVMQSLYSIGRAMFDDYSNDVDNVIKATDKLLFERGIEPGSNYYSKDKADTNIRFIRVGDMLSSVPENYVERGLCQNSILKDSDVAMSFDATIGRVSYGISGGFSSGLRKISSKDTHISNAFIYYYLTSNEVQKTLLENATGTTILHAGKSIDHFKLPYNNSAAKKISEKLQSIFERQLSIKQQNKTLIELRDTILPKLMSGEIDLEGVVV